MEAHEEQGEHEVTPIVLSASRTSPESEFGGQFHGIAEPKVLIQEEQPYHRHAAYLMAMGADTREVANALDVTTTAVRQWLRQPWFQERVSLILKEHGGKDLTQLFANEAFASLSVMVELRDSGKTPAAVRNNICQDILNRHLGKPVQRMESVTLPHSDDPVAEEARLRTEVEHLRSQSE